MVTLLAVKRTKIVDAVFFCLLPRAQPDPPLDGRSVFKNMRKKGMYMSYCRIHIEKVHTEISSH